MTKPGSLTGDPRTDAHVDTAAQLAAATHEFDGNRVAALINGTTDLSGLVVTLAAMVPDDRTPTELLAWHARPGEYERLRRQGVDCLTGNDVIAGSMKRSSTA